MIWRNRVGVYPEFRLERFLPARKNLTTVSCLRYNADEVIYAKAMDSYH